MLGDQVKCTLNITIGTLLLHLIPFRIYLIFIPSDSPPYYILWIGSTLISIFSYIISLLFEIRDSIDTTINNQIKIQHYSVVRALSTIFLQVGICIALTLIMVFLNDQLETIDVRIVMITDVVLYSLFVIINLIKKPRNCFGLAFNAKSLNCWQIRVI